MRAAPSRRPLRRFLSRISFRLLAFNLLLVFLPAFGILSLETYEEELLKLQERSMVQQGRLLAAALSGRGELDGSEAERILVNMRQQWDARLRVVDRERRLLADSARLGPRLEGPPPEPAAVEARRSLLYRLGSLLYRGLARFFLPPEPPLRDSEFYAESGKLAGPEIETALGGDYGRATRVTPGARSLTLYSALPVFDGGEAVGAVLVSKSTFQILRALYDFRLSTFRVILASVAAAVVLSLFLSTTIARPLRRLRKEARALLDRRGRLKRGFRGSERLDEIGDLSRALAELTRRLESHLRFTESFASDVSHELKNPLASIRNATEILGEVDDPAERRRFLGMIERDVARLEHLLAGVREVTRIDARLEEQSVAPVDLGELLATLVRRFEMRNGGEVAFRLAAPEEPAVVSASPDRLAQVFENLLDNSAGFSPRGGEVRIEVLADDARARVRIRDRGPGIPEEHLDRVFGRFFSYRPGQEARRDEHSGLGLAIVKAIVEGYGGTVRAANAEGGGALLEVELPRG